MTSDKELELMITPINNLCVTYTPDNIEKDMGDELTTQAIKLINRNLQF